MKIILHIDLNCFFAQCEVLRDPSLRGKPIAVGSDMRRGVLSTASYEARKFGVNSAMPVSEAKRLCRKLILVEPHFRLYHNYSQKFFSYLRKKFPILEQASVDECYVDATDKLTEENLHEQLFDLQMELYHATSLKCSIGAGPNKFLAKMASDMKKPLGITIIKNENIEQVLWPLPIGKMFGVGKKTQEKLIRLGIQTIGDLALTNDSRVKSDLGSMYAYFKRNANGIGDDFVDPSDFDPKSISAERTFAEDEMEYEALREMINTLCDQVYREMVKYHKTSNVVGIKLRTPDFVTKSKRMTIDHEIDDLPSLAHYAMKVFDGFYRDQPVRLIGVFVDAVKDKQGEKKTAEMIRDLNKQLEEPSLFSAAELEEKR